jgi:predicted MFS family arabinose efflux permease
MLYSEVAVLGTDKLTEWFSRIFRNYSMYIALGMNIVALMIFAFTQNMAGMIIALLVMGISAAYGKPIQQNYFLKLNVVKDYGEDKSIGIYNFSENIGESLGPEIFCRLMEAVKLTNAIGMFCTVITGMGFLHYIICRKEGKHDAGKIHTST